MRTQDYLFLVFFVVLAFFRSRHTWIAGIICTVAAGLLFSLDNLFTSQRLSWYAAAFFSLTVVKQTLYFLYHKE